MNPSPDAQYLLVSWFERPYSFNVPCGRFPRRTELWDRCDFCFETPVLTIHGAKLLDKALRQSGKELCIRSDLTVRSKSSFCVCLHCRLVENMHVTWCREGNSLAEICSLPLAEDIPITFNSVRKGRRSLDWRDDRPAELSWMETQA